MTVLSHHLLFWGHRRDLLLNTIASAWSFKYCFRMCAKVYLLSFIFSRHTSPIIGSIPFLKRRKVIIYLDLLKLCTSFQCMNASKNFSSCETCTKKNVSIHWKQNKNCLSSWNVLYYAFTFFAQEFLQQIKRHKFFMDCSKKIFPQGHQSLVIFVVSSSM